MARKQLRESLIDKGWKKEEVDKAIKTMYSEEPTKHDYISNPNKILYWSTLLIAIVGNLVISLVLVPFFLVLSNLVLYFIIFVIGLTFGALFNMLVRDIQTIDPTHHVIAGVFLPALSLINIIVVVDFANKFNSVLKISSFSQNPYVVSVVYVVSFMLPYLIDQGFLAKRKK